MNDAADIAHSRRRRAAARAKARRADDAWRERAMEAMRCLPIPRSEEDADTMRKIIDLYRHIQDLDVSPKMTRDAAEVEQSLAGKIAAYEQANA